MRNIKKRRKIKVKSNNSHFHCFISIKFEIKIGYGFSLSLTHSLKSSFYGSLNSHARNIFYIYFFGYILFYNLASSLYSSLKIVIRMCEFEKHAIAAVTILWELLLTKFNCSWLTNSGSQITAVLPFNNRQIFLGQQRSLVDTEEERTMDEEEDGWK